MRRPKLLPTIILAAVAVTGAGTAWGQAAPPASKPTVACQVMGHDVVLQNRGEAALPAGTVVKWFVRFGRHTGEHKLDAALMPFVGHYLVGALGASYLWDRACTAEVVPVGAAPTAPAATQ
jgi:hypothetical protein